MAGSRESASRRVDPLRVDARAGDQQPIAELKPSLIIDCDTCEMRDISCDDCVISFLIGPPPERSTLTLADPEAQAMAALAEVGLVPPLRLVPPPKGAR